MEMRDEEFIKPTCSNGERYKAEKLITTSSQKDVRDQDTCVVDRLTCYLFLGEKNLNRFDFDLIFRLR